MYEGSHVPLEIMSDFYGKVAITSTFTGFNLDTADTNSYDNECYCPAEFTRTRHETVHGHILPA